MGALLRILIPARPENSPSGERTLSGCFVRCRRIKQRDFAAGLFHGGDRRGGSAGNGDVHFGFQLAARKEAHAVFLADRPQDGGALAGADASCYGLRIINEWRGSFPVGNGEPR